MRICRECKKEKPNEKFELIISPIKYGGNGKSYRRKICKACKSIRINAEHKEYRKEYNIKNKNKRIRRAEDIRNNVKQVLNGIKNKPCTDCHKTFAPIAMDFDHINDKHKEISRMLSGAYKLDLILNEIKKCDLVCVCCHRIRTLKRKPRKKYSKTNLADYIDKIKSQTPCLVCSQYFPPECMDFDHRNPTEKLFNIELMRRYSVKNISKLLEEMAKCDILCACCHRIKTKRSVSHEKINCTRR